MRAWAEADAVDGDRGHGGSVAIRTQTQAFRIHVHGPVAHARQWSYPEARMLRRRCRSRPDSNSGTMWAVSMPSSRQLSRYFCTATLYSKCSNGSMTVLKRGSRSGAPPDEQCTGASQISSVPVGGFGCVTRGVLELEQTADVKRRVGEQRRRQRPLCPDLGIHHERLPCHLDLQRLLVDVEVRPQAVGVACPRGHDPNTARRRRAVSRGETALCRGCTADL